MNRMNGKSPRKVGNLQRLGKTSVEIRSQFVKPTLAAIGVRGFQTLKRTDQIKNQRFDGYLAEHVSGEELVETQHKPKWFAAGECVQRTVGRAALCQRIVPTIAQLNRKHAAVGENAIAVSQTCRMIDECQRLVGNRLAGGSFGVLALQEQA